ncbi:SAM-dependent methyltransferase [Luedemannella flava]|uniref:SAM-dependent methyltransferase n=1 Tax=Luedemannella flava TaxID=349316 RepID=A0ABN2MEG9_9ACTN
MPDEDWMRMESDEVRPAIDLHTDRPHPARVYDYLLGGKTNFAADREAAEAGIRANPTSTVTPRQNRAWMTRAVRFLAAEAGVRQFLDIGTGIPTAPNAHQTAQEVAPESRIVYVDNDPIVLVHARALLTGTPEGRTEYVNADLRDVTKILESEQVRDVIDFDEPVGLLLIAVLHFINAADDPYGLVERLVDALPSGSYLALSHLTTDVDPPIWERVQETFRRNGVTMHMRSRAGVERFFKGLELVEPGVQQAHHWRPDTDPATIPDNQVAIFAGVARKP